MRLPKYRKHSQKDFAFIELDGKRIRLPGRYNSPESRQAYAEYRTSLVRNLPPPEFPATTSSVNALILRYGHYASVHYQGSGPRGEYSNITHVLKSLSQHYGHVHPESFGPLLLKELRSKWIEIGWSRSYINASIGRVKRMFRWAVSEEIVRPEVLTALESVQGLMPQRTAAKERTPRGPISWEDVAPVLDHVSPVVRDMILVQWYTGVRSDSLCNASRDQFHLTPNGWIWKPKHKSQHLNRELIIPIGPQCQKVLEPYLSKEGFLFCPKEVRINRRYGQRYTTSTYRQAVQRGQSRAGLRDNHHRQRGWVPHQLRHARGTIVRSRLGIEAAQAVLGHADLDATQIYAQKSQDLAWQAARELG